MLDDYHAASIDFSNAFTEQHSPTSLKVAAVATCTIPTPALGPLPRNCPSSAPASPIMKRSHAFLHPSQTPNHPTYSIVPLTHTVLLRTPPNLPKPTPSDYAPRATLALPHHANNSSPQPAVPLACNLPRSMRAMPPSFPRLPVATSARPG